MADKDFITAVESEISQLKACMEHEGISLTGGVWGAIVKRLQDAVDAISQDQGIIVSKIIANLATATGTSIDDAAYAIHRCENLSKYVSVARAVAVYYKDSNHELGEMARAALGLAEKGGG